MQDDELIFLDLGGSYKKDLQFLLEPKYYRYEKIRTDISKERSYTYGLNQIMPTARSEWICLWRSDYIYSKNYFCEVLAGMKDANLVVPYEALIGANYCDAKWCRKRLKCLINSDEDVLLMYAHVCPVYEMMDYPHFAIKKKLWLQSKGMNEKLWGYGWQFPELFNRLKSLENYSISVKFGMIAFHQNHFGSFSLGLLTDKKKNELLESDKKMLDLFGSKDAVEEFKRKVRQAPLRERRNENSYIPKMEERMTMVAYFKEAIERCLRGV